MRLKQGRAGQIRRAFLSFFHGKIFREPEENGKGHSNRETPAAERLLEKVQAAVRNKSMVS